MVLVCKNKVSIFKNLGLVFLCNKTLIYKGDGRVNGELGTSGSPEKTCTSPFTYSLYLAKRERGI